ncbi:MAG: TonB-dependent receptor, partial [Gammaproteobacteria bacterium]|nr:TonB-dependent receptor [Gammaproteobacteria bacterium]
MLHFRMLAAMLVFVVLQPSSQAAETETRQSNPDTANLDTITVTASLRERPLREVANSITVIDAARISEILAADIKDLTRYTPWMSVANDPSRFGLSGFNIRGLTGNRVKTVIDGVPVANSFSVGSYSSSGRDAISPSMVSNAEVLRGPASALFGSDAMGGVVSYTTFAPDDFLLGSNKSRYFGASTRYDGRDNSLAASITAATQLTNAAMLISATMRRGHEIDNRAISDAGRPNPRSNNQFDFAGKFVLPTSSGEITLGIDGRRTHVTTEVDDLEGQGRFASTTFLQGDDRLTRDRVSLAGQMRMDSTLADDVRWAVYFQQSSTDQRSIEERAASSRSPSPTRRFPEFRFDEKVTGASASAARDVRKGRLMHRLLYGLQLDRRTVNESRDNLLVNLDTGAATKVVLGETFPVRDFPVTQITEAAVFLHDEITPGEGRFTLIPGLRAEYYRLDPQPDSVYTEDNPSSGVVSISEVSLAPKLGAVIQLNESTSLFAQYARGFRSPPFEDANIGLEVPLFNVRAIANPDLKPETSDGVEIGLRVV